MSMSSDTPRENLTLSESDLAACRPIVGEGGHVLRTLCPFHGSDRQRSLRVQVHSGRFVCFACGAWGYMDTARAQWREEQQRQAAFPRPPARRQRMPSRRQPPPPRARPPAAAARKPSADPPAPRASAPGQPDLAQQLAAFQAALPGSRGDTYLQQRGIPLAPSRIVPRAGRKISPTVPVWSRDPQCPPSYTAVRFLCFLRRCRGRWLTGPPPP